MSESDIVRFRFKINQNIKVIALNLQGKILARCDRGLYHEYRVIYWSEGKRNDEWLCEYELVELNNKH